jgi:light-regulated signal transduction histidine kinase (bacteriophytochrome)
MNDRLPTSFLAECEREQLHRIGAIQPDGALIGSGFGEERVRFVSTNLAEWLGRGPGEVLGRPIAELLPHFTPDEGLGAGRRQLHQDLADGPRGRLDGLLSHSDEGWLLELQPALPEDQRPPATNQALKGLFKAPREQADWTDYCQLLTREVREASGFDRVMVYRFLGDGSGEVIAEDAAAGLSPYLGLRYPASDIPQVARDLYVLNSHRQIADVEAAPVPILALGDQEADLSHADLRAVSPVHIQYLKNMEVRASLSFSVVINGELWGLIACHHRTPRWLPLTLRERCVEMVEVFQLGIAGHQSNRRLAALTIIDDAIERVMSALHLAEHEGDPGLLGPGLLGLVRAGGAVLYEDGDISCFGETPPKSAIEPLVQWLHHEHLAEPIFATDALSAAYPPAAAFVAQASGLLAVRTISSIANIELERTFLWFRPEMPQTVHWAGDPRKSAMFDSQSATLSPRSSFELWIETTTGRCDPWGDTDRLAAKKFRNLILRGLNPRLLRL